MVARHALSFAALIGWLCIATLACGAPESGAEPATAAPGDGDTITFHQQIAWSPDGSKIAFCAMRLSKVDWEEKSYDALEGRDYDIWVINADGSGARRLTDNPGYDLWLSWSPDGERIVYGSDRDGNTDLWIMRADGSEQTRLTDGPGKESGPSWSPDGGRIAYMSQPGEHWQIRIMNADGSGDRALTGEEVDHYNPVFSPDGRSLLFYADLDGSGADQVWILPLDDPGPPRRVATGIFPGWAPDGRSIVHAGDGIHRVSADGSDPQRLLAGGFFARWSPDGKRLAFIDGRFPDTAIWVASSEDPDGTRRRLTD